jgi:hypothetical protein
VKAEIRATMIAMVLLKRSLSREVSGSAIGALG